MPLQPLQELHLYTLKRHGRETIPPMVFHGSLLVGAAAPWTEVGSSGQDRVGNVECCSLHVLQAAASCSSY